MEQGVSRASDPEPIFSKGHESDPPHYSGIGQYLRNLVFELQRIGS